MKLPLHRVAAGIAQRTLDTKVSQRKLAREIAAYLLSTGRTGELGSLARELVRLRAAAGTVEVAAVSAHKLSPAALAEVKKRARALYPSAKHLSISEVIDPAVIGGVRLELVDQQLDLTVRTRLNRFKQLALAERF